METQEHKYTLGFVFDNSLRKVLLVHKQKPDWQRGRVNGVGGKYEPGETTEVCIRRETKEETTLDIPDWTFIGTIRQPQGNVSVSAAIHSGALTDAAKGDYEEVEWFEAENLPANVMDNLRWLIPLCREKLQHPEKSFSDFLIEY